MEAQHSRLARRGLVVAVTVSVLAVAMIGSTSAASPKTKLVSQSSGGAQANDATFEATINANGKFIAFATKGINLGGVDSNGSQDIYVRNMKTGSTKLVSRSSTGTRGNKDSFRPDVSATGRYVVFDSDATNLVKGITTAGRQVFLHDRKTGKTKLMSVNSNEQMANNQSTSPRISADGRFVVFVSHGSNMSPKAGGGGSHIYLRDRAKGKTQLISKNNKGKAGIQDGTPGGSSEPDISPDGRRIVYSSVADNLATQDDFHKQQIYMYNRDTGRTSLVSKNKAGKAGRGGGSARASVSTKANVIVFHSGASNLIGPDNNETGDIFRRANGKTSLVGRNWQGKQTDAGSFFPDISANGRYLSFESKDSNVIKSGTSGTINNVYVRDLKSGKVTLASRKTSKANGDVRAARISADGKFVVMQSAATNLISGGDANGSETDILRRGALR